jgi:flagellar L-ring protein precursor FlgH
MNRVFIHSGAFAVCCFGLLHLSAGRAFANDAPEQAVVAPVKRSFYADRQAFRPGDMLTVMIVETAAANSTARTRADKGDKVSASASRVGVPDHGFSVGANNQFSGGGEIQRSGQLLGKLTVVVNSIDANGNLLVTGEQNIVINNEEQHIAVRGALRPADIAPDNTVPSWRIMDAHIEFKGKGILARKQSPGFLTKLFDLFGIN